MIKLATSILRPLVLVTSNLAIYRGDFFKDANYYELSPKKGFRSWTDDYSNQILKEH